MLDKNELRGKYRDLFCKAIAQYRRQVLQEDEGCSALAGAGPSGTSSGSRPGGGRSGGAVQVFVRKRPLFDKDRRDGDYDVFSTVPRQVVLHNCLLEADLRSPFVKHHHFKFDCVFGQSAENREVYSVAAADLVRSASKGGVGTMFMLGQTGSGKTHTMSAIEEMAAHDLFHDADAAGGEPLLAVQFVELRGNRCYDLLSSSASAGGGGAAPELRLRERADGAYVPEGATSMVPKSAKELCAILQAAHSRRATSATNANEVSSRSHAVCVLRMLQAQGQLMLVDCAGSERRKDSMHHTRERQQEGAEINASLYALKECIRYMTTKQEVPSHAYRASALTKVLADAFIRAREARLSVICCCSPCASDTEHTLTTLRTGMSFGGHGAEREEKEPLKGMLREQRGPRELHPKQWTPEQVRAWFSDVDAGRYASVLETLPSNFTGQMLMRVTETRFVQMCGGNTRRGHHVFELLHQEISRVEQSRKQFAA